MSLAYVDLLTKGLSDEDREMIAAGVVFHHRTYERLRELYPFDADWKEKFGRQVKVSLRDELAAWYRAMLGSEAPLPDGGPKLWERARDQFEAVSARWSEEVPEADGLMAVLLQGAVTLADRAASAGVDLETARPGRSGYIEHMAAPYSHQRRAAAAQGHLILISPTGSGKTEAGLAWASSQVDAMSGVPRLVWLLPYRASIDAARDRFADDFGGGPDSIGVLHATAAATLLDRVTCDDRAPGKEDAVKARAMSGAMRLFRQTVRVATPHQLLRAAVAGPKYSSVLLEQANSVFVLDELHAYDPVTFGRICAAMTLWERLGSRVAVVSATLAWPMISLVRESLSIPVTLTAADPGTAPVRHRLAVDPRGMDAPESLDRIGDWLGEGRSVLVVANRVAVAQTLFALLAADDDSAVLLHSRFRYGDRAAIEKRIHNQHGQRAPGDPALRGGGLVVSTQCLEVSLCLDFDRGVSELAPVEALAQRAGRVNRLGRHPDGAVEFRVHETESALPYDDGALDAARLALRGWDGKLISEQAIEEWLARAYDTDWGRSWEKTARESREQFASSFLTFDEPFSDRSAFAEKLDEQFNTVEVLLAEDLETYRARVSGDDGDPMLAAELLIPVRWDQKARLQAEGRAKLDSGLGIWVIDAPYDPRTGLDLTPPEPAETIL
jgi:CRISPR-associated endonuclease/helicase Cas3